MGYDMFSNEAVTITVMVWVLEMIREYAKEAVPTEAHQLMKVGAFLVSCHSYSGLSMWV